MINNFRIRDFLRADGSIVVNKRLARKIGLDAAVMYSELISKYAYYAGNGSLESDGSFYSTIEDMERDTTLSVRQQKTAIKILTTLRLVDYEVRGLPPKRYFRLPDDESTLISILEDGITREETEPKNQFEQNAQIQAGRGFEQNAQIEYVQNAQIEMSETHKTICANRSSNNTNIILKNNTKESQNIGAKAQAQSNTLFDLPRREEKKASASRIDQARSTGDWSKVTATEFLKYFIERQNEVFPVQIRFSQSKETNYTVSQFRKNFIERFQIPAEEVCQRIDDLIRTYKATESDPRYNKCFSIDTFHLTWKIDKLMEAVDRADRYTQDPLPTYEDRDDIPEVF